MFKTSNCNRTRLVAALFLCMLFCQVPPAVADSFDRMFHLKHQSQSQFLNDCVYVDVLDDGKTVELDATANSLSSLGAIDCLALKSLNHNVLKPPIPLNQPQFVDSHSCFLSGCQYGYLN